MKTYEEALATWLRQCSWIATDDVVERVSVEMTGESGVDTSMWEEGGILIVAKVYSAAHPKRSRTCEVTVYPHEVADFLRDLIAAGQEGDAGE